MKGRKLTVNQVSRVATLHRKGVNRQEISEQVSLGYSTVCKLIYDASVVATKKKKKSYAVAVDKKVYDYVTRQSKKNSITRSEAMSEILRLSQRKRWLFF